MYEGRRKEALAKFEPKLKSALALPGSDHKIPLYECVAERIGTDAPIRYLEFGVFDGTSMRKIKKLFAHAECEFIGFDSFLGLPEDWAHLKRGKFDCGGSAPRFSDPRVCFVEGWFQNTVPAFLSGLHFRPAMTTLVHFDADLYSSTLFLLTALWFAVSEYYFVFDEYHFDEVVALQDFMSAFPVEIEFFARTPGPMQVAGKLSRKPLVI